MKPSVHLSGSMSQGHCLTQLQLGTPYPGPLRVAMLTFIIILILSCDMFWMSMSSPCPDFVAVSAIVAVILRQADAINNETKQACRFNVQFAAYCSTYWLSCSLSPLSHTLSHSSHLGGVGRNSEWQNLQLVGLSISLSAEFRDETKRQGHRQVRAQRFLRHHQQAC